MPLKCSLSILKAVSVAILIGLQLGMQPALAGPGFDLRECPIGLVKFYEPWSKSEFSVSRAGANYYYLCDKSGEQSVALPGEECSRFGDLALVGTLKSGWGEPERDLTAIWSVAKASPCCGWTITETGKPETENNIVGIQWMDLSKTEKLGSFGFASIENDEMPDGLSAIACVATP